MVRGTTKFVTIIQLLTVGAGDAFAETETRTAAPSVINVVLSPGGAEPAAEIWISDGTSHINLFHVAETVKQYGATDINLMVCPADQDFDPNEATNRRQVAIQFTSDRVDVFLTHEVPFRFTEILCFQLSRMSGIREVRLRHAEVVANMSQSARTAAECAIGCDSDPFAEDNADRLDREIEGPLSDEFFDDDPFED